MGSCCGCWCIDHIDANRVHLNPDTTPEPPPEPQESSECTGPTRTLPTPAESPTRARGARGGGGSFRDRPGPNVLPLSTCTRDTRSRSFVVTDRSYYTLLDRGRRKFSGSSEVASRNGLSHFAVTRVPISGAPSGESAAAEHLKADPRRDERDFVTANFREFVFPALR